ncbi:MAG: efflux RND transporter periplasmic adaptor subunit [Candidatus Aminicenantes bacterium]|nr:efflux RND transporter periplasmic adaptor subunit [Candidatus Aminicenantes bacterium]
MKRTSRWILWAALAALVINPGCRDKSAPEAAARAGEDHDHENEAASKTSVTLTPQAVATADIRTEPAAPRALARRIAAPGELEFNARRLAHLTARTPGRVERVLAVEGDRVAGGQVLAELYSPDFMALQAEYRVLLTKRVGVVGFAGLADIFAGLGEFRLERLKYSLGSGVRYVINARDGTTVRLDMAWGRASFGLYLTAREAF